MGPKIHKTVGGYLGWITGTTLRYVFIIGSGYGAISVT